jgi:hypothetical protein
MKNKKVFYGSTHEFATRLRPGGNFVVTTETGEFAQPSHRDVGRGTVSVRGYHGVTLSITKAQQIRSKDPEAAFVNNFSQKTEDALYILQRNINREFYGSGLGTLCKISSFSNPTATIDTTAYPFNTRHLAQGDLCQLFPDETSGAAHATSFSVSEAFHAYNQFKSDTDITTPVTAQTPNVYVVISGNRTTSTFREFNGLGSIMSASSTYANINPATVGNGYWKAHVNAVSGDLDLSHIISMCQEIQMSTGVDPQVALIAPEMIPVLNDLNSGGIFYTSAEIGKVGYRAPTVYLPSASGDGEMELKFKQDFYCPPGRIYLMNPSEWSMLMQMDIQYLDDKGQPVQRIPRTQIFEGQLVCALEPYTDNRMAFGLISGLTYSNLSFIQ